MANFDRIELIEIESFEMQLNQFHSKNKMA